MNVLAAMSWADVLRDQPLEAALAAVALGVAAVLIGLGLRAATQRTRSLHRLVLAITLSAFAIGALVTFLLARLMLLDAGQARTVVGVLVVSACFAAVLAAVASVPLRRDVRQLEATLRRLESGDLAARTGVRRGDELGHVARALDELTERLDELERERDGVDQERRLMLTSVGHDLRTPLAALRVAIEALADGVAPDPDRYLRAMANDVAALTSLVDDLFLLSRIEGGRLELPREPIDLTEIADEAVDALTPAAVARGVDVRLRAPDAVLVDGNAAALARVIRNLLDNAIRHAPPGSHIEVDVDDAARPRVRVTDQGEGFAASFAPAAFDRFTRAEPSRNRTSGGAGLGLAIARGLVRAHGGDIRVEPPPGGRVVFELPARDPAPEPA